MSGDVGETVTRQFHVYDNMNNDVTSQCTFTLDRELECLTIDKVNKLLTSNGQGNVRTYLRVITASLNELTSIASISVTIQQSHDYSQDYLTFEALESGTFTLTIPAEIDTTYMTSISYSVDNGTNWVTTAIDNTSQTITTPTIAQGDKVLWKGEGSALAENGSSSINSSKFSSTGNFNVCGNAMSLLYGVNFENQTAFPNGSSYNFAVLFGYADKLISAENLVLPATTLAQSCYSNMFKDCTSLTTAPVLPATTLATGCYNDMFKGCRALTTAPTTLPATTLASWCYEYMFYGCSSLRTAPVLPATTLADNCYSYMFDSCTSLNYIKMLATDITAYNCLKDWVYGVAANGVFTKAASMTALPEGSSGIPTNWTVLNEL